ncbi:type I-E CRISPR-associated endoribonuclease Cas2e [Corynebacterium lubricantis]|uniref:type I-E CRISPR-associated endoribonuclease Cas2e n=1 Tax=Corynebacterium lubricantis TaxID=541095 RepID=UPI0003630E65|nr:type I-E CRISPR-associated endoribonuclease Cas2e [Corynebacterium lubricantis]
MIVLVITACPAGLRGDLTKWLTEIAPGVFVGRPGARIRELIWEHTVALCKDGKALLVQSSDNEQGMEIRTHKHDWEPTDFDGLTLMVRPDRKNKSAGSTGRKTGWATARYTRKK